MKDKFIGGFFAEPNLLIIHALDKLNNQQTIAEN